MVHGRDTPDLVRLVVDDDEGAVLRGETAADEREALAVVC